MAHVTRRQVLSSSISTAALLAAHPSPLLAAPMQASAGSAPELPVRCSTTALISHSQNRLN